VGIGVLVGVYAGVGVGGDASSRTISPNADVSSQLFKQKRIIYRAML
jgi:hypothetical protein